MKICSNSTTASVLLGINGAVIVSNTSLQTGPFYAIKAITDCVISSATLEDVDGSLNGVTIKAGDLVMLFRISSITLTSGTAILYKA